LLESKESSDGLLYLYNYDDIGRIASVVLPTGEVMTISVDSDVSGVHIDIDEGGVRDAAVITSGNTLLISTGIVYKK